MKRSDFHYELPVELIAQQPRPRASARMLVVDRGSGNIEHSRFSSFPSLLGPDDVLVLNDTAVIPARLYGSRPGNMKQPIEFLLTRPLSPLEWTVWCKPARRVRVGDEIEFSERLRADVVSKNEDGSAGIRFQCRTEEELWGEIDRIGVTPLPPYIRRPAGVRNQSDAAAYQTVYAERRGAVAAPTAGLHFSEAVLDEIAARGVEILRLTLHVGIGTFQAVKVEDLTRHKMETERYAIPVETASRVNAALREGRRIVAVGTTTVRALESAIGEDGKVKAGEGETSMFITPGHDFRVIGALLTNFHLPESTLLMLVSAFAGVDLVREAYEQAVTEAYLFYSFGDCMFVR